MSVAQLWVVIALLGSIVLIAQSPARLFPAIALVASGLETLLAFRVVSFTVSGVNLGFVLALALVVGGGGAWMKSSGKSTVSAATAVTLIGALQAAAVLA